MTFTRWLFASVAVLLCAVTSAAHAGGFYLTDRGTRPLGRGFAFVAGADDPGAIWYNPAGIAGLGTQLFGDATYTNFRADYTRVLVDQGNVIDQYGNVSMSPLPVPIPMLALTHDFGLREFTFGAAVIAPNAAIAKWPEDRDAAQRYSLLRMDGTLLSQLALAAAWQPTTQFSLGLSLGAWVGTFHARTAVSACDGTICTQPENPNYDGIAEVKLFPLIAPTATLGARYDAGPVRFGLSITTPHTIGGDAHLLVRLPSAAVFDGASLRGDRAAVNVDFPWIVRAGVEARPNDRLRVEGAVVYEAWSVQRNISIVPKNVTIEDVVGIGSYDMGAIDIPRNMNDVISLRVGGEFTLTPESLVLRAGANYETSSFDDAYLSALTLDASKLVIGIGASFKVSDAIWLDVSYGHVFMADPSVRNSRVPQNQAIRPARDPNTPGPQGGLTYVGDGDYAMEGDMFGVGLRWTLSAATSAVATSENSRSQ